MRIPLAYSLTFLALGTSAVAQTKFCIGGQLDDLTPAQITSCQAKSSALRMQARLHGTPENWHFVVICDEAGWSTYASLAGNDTKLVLASAQNTDSALRFTFVRASHMEEGSQKDADLVLASVKRTLPNAQRRRAIPAARPAFTSPMLTALRQVPVGFDNP